MREDIVPGFRPEQAPPSAKWLGMEPISWVRETMVLRVAFNPPRDVINFGGVVQGGFLVAMMDDAMGFNCFICLGMVNAQASIDIHTHFLRPVRKGAIEVVARLRNVGRAMLFAEAELYDSRGKEAARSTASLTLNPVLKPAT